MWVGKFLGFEFRGRRFQRWISRVKASCRSWNLLGIGMGCAGFLRGIQGSLRGGFGLVHSLFSLECF